MTNAVQVLTDSTVDHEIGASTVPVLVEVGAEWCPPCRAMGPVLAAVAAEYGERVRVFTVDADHNRGVVARFGVLGLPTFLVFSEGQLARRLVGARSKHRLVAELDGLLT